MCEDFINHAVAEWMHPHARTACIVVTLLKASYLALIDLTATTVTPYASTAVITSPNCQFFASLPAVQISQHRETVAISNYCTPPDQLASQKMLSF